MDKNWRAGNSFDCRRYVSKLQTTKEYLNNSQSHFSANQPSVSTPIGLVPPLNKNHNNSASMTLHEAFSNGRPNPVPTSIDLFQHIDNNPNNSSASILHGNEHTGELSNAVINNIGIISVDDIFESLDDNREDSGSLMMPPEEDLNDPLSIADTNQSIVSNLSDSYSSPDSNFNNSTPVTSDSNYSDKVLNADIEQPASSNRDSLFIADSYLPTMSNLVGQKNTCSNERKATNKANRPEKRQEGRVKRPMNGFMVWSREERKKIAKENPGLHNSAISKMLGLQWRKLDPAIKKVNNEKAQELREEHMKRYPDYKYKPRRKPKQGFNENQYGMINGNRLPTSSSNFSAFPFKKCLPAVSNQSYQGSCAEFNVPYSGGRPVTCFEQGISGKNIYSSSHFSGRNYLSQPTTSTRPSPYTIPESPYAAKNMFAYQNNGSNRQLEIFVPGFNERDYNFQNQALNQHSPASNMRPVVKSHTDMTEFLQTASTKTTTPRLSSSSDDAQSSFLSNENRAIHQTHRATPDSYSPGSNSSESMVQCPFAKQTTSSIFSPANSSHSNFLPNGNYATHWSSDIPISGECSSRVITTMQPQSVNIRPNCYRYLLDRSVSNENFVGFSSSSTMPPNPTFPNDMVFSRLATIPSANSSYGYKCNGQPQVNNISIGNTTYHGASSMCTTESSTTCPSALMATKSENCAIEPSQTYHVCGNQMRDPNISFQMSQNLPFHADSNMSSHAYSNTSFSTSPVYDYPGISPINKVSEMDCQQPHKRL